MAWLALVCLLGLVIIGAVGRVVTALLAFDFTAEPKTRRRQVLLSELGTAAVALAWVGAFVWMGTL